MHENSNAGDKGDQLNGCSARALSWAISDALPLSSIVERNRLLQFTGIVEHADFAHATCDG